MNWCGRDHLIEALRQLSERLGRTRGAMDAKTDPHTPSHNTYALRFGSWRKALEAAGIPLNPRNTGYDREELLRHLQDLAPTVRDLQTVDGPCDRTCRKRFGTWSAALAEAGSEIHRRGRRYDRDELLDALRGFVEQLDRTPTTTELEQRDDLPRPSTYRPHFGRWNAALREAGLAPRHPMGCSEDGDDR